MLKLEDERFHIRLKNVGSWHKTIKSKNLEILNIYAVILHTKAVVAVLLSDRIDFMAKNIGRVKRSLP